MFTDIVPIIEENRKFVIKRMIETNILKIDLEKPISIEDDTYFYMIYSVVLNKNLQNLRFLYRYGTNINELDNYDWFLVNDFPLLTENEILKKVSEKLA